MYQKLRSVFSDLFFSGHSFEKDEILLKFQYRVINTILFVMAFFTFVFALLSSLGIDPLGMIQTIVNYLLVLCSIILIVRLRGPKSRYLQSAYLMYAAAFVDFVSALLFVPHDEFRIIWFYLLVFASYITGGIRAGNIVSIASIFTVISANIFYDLQLSETAIVSSVLGLIIASLFFRSYTKKIIDFENEITDQQNQLAKFNGQLEIEVAQKTQELQDFNACLENIVAQKVAKITEQEQLMISQSRLAAMGEMMSMIAHQWRQPLSTTTLMITNERVKSMMAGKEPSECEKILDSISDTMIYLSDTIDDFQTYFKPDKATEEIAVLTLIERTKQFIHTRLVMEKVQIHIEEGEAETIETYANEVVQVLINIINNAIDALSERGIDKPQIWISIHQSDTEVKIGVEDNAGGIDNDIIEKVFDPYFSKKSKNGTGLGLYMAKMIIDKHVGGRLDVYNTQRGAHFTIVLPKKSPQKLLSP